MLYLLSSRLAFEVLVAFTPAAGHSPGLQYALFRIRGIFPRRRKMNCFSCVYVFLSAPAVVFLTDPVAGACPGSRTLGAASLWRA